MPPTRRRRWSHLVVPGVIAVLFVARCNGGLREDELECEQAANQLAGCCPGFEVRKLSCSYTDGCGTSYPALTIDESECIVSESCSTLQKTEVCARAAAAVPIMSTDDGGGLTEHPQVCP
jgi:hypothetical protein